MSTLTLVRHAQARAFEKHSDRLSELGEQQARVLGDWWAARGVTFTEVWCGTLERQRRTAELAGIRDMEVNAAWNEYDAARILRFSPEGAGPFTSNREFQRVFEAVMLKWVAGEIAAADLESFEAFCARVASALKPIVEDERPGRRVLVVTSGGPIGAAVQMALAAPARMAVELNWRVRNCSITEFLFTKGRIALDSFNGTPHLAAELVSYR